MQGSRAAGSRPLHRRISASFADKPRGVVLYDRLASDYPDHPFADDALFFAADLDEKLGDDDAALAELEKLAESAPPIATATSGPRGSSACSGWSGSAATCQRPWACWIGF